MNEFDLIRRYFSFSGPEAGGGVALGIGDDCALLEIAAGRQLAVTTDTLVSGVHFPADGDPSLIARRALRVNLSDLAAMGAAPLGFQLAISLPGAEPAWLEGFSAGLAEDARVFNCPLVGGDTTRGPLAITVTMMGTVAAGRALRRSGAGPGDLVCVSGSLGDAAAALAGLAGRLPQEYLGRRYWLPDPRLALGELLVGIASAGLDISDGLIQDVGHIARANGLTAVIERQRLPLSPALIAEQGEEAGRDLALAGGDDYELCFTIGERQFAAIASRAEELGCPLARVGRMQTLSPNGDYVVCVDAAGQPLALERVGYDHFGI